MTRNELYLHAQGTFNKGLALAKKKNQDYANEKDPFFNLRRGGLHGIAVRTDDKVCRLLNLSGGAEAAVKEESIRDTLLDVFNYCWLALAMMDEGKTPSKSLGKRMEEATSTVRGFDRVAFMKREHGKPATTESAESTGEAEPLG